MIQQKIILNAIIIFSLIIFDCNESKNYIKKSNSGLINNDERILDYEVNLRESKLAFYLKNENGFFFNNHNNLKKWLNKKGEKLKFAVNGGMFKKDFSPQGLYIEDGKEISKLDDKEDGYGNFYLKPNGVLLIRKDKTAKIVSSDQYKKSDQIEYATQSGPMLVINGEIHPEFNKGSKNLHIRNGVGLLPNGNLLFAMSKAKINFYDFAEYFIKNKCRNALYLDGFVSRTYLPSKDWIQEDGNFAVIIGEIE